MTGSSAPRWFWPRSVFWCRLRQASGAVCLLLAGAGVAAELKAVNGTPAKPLVLKTLDGTEHNLAQYRGKVVTKNWSARILPASYLIGRDGRVHYSVVGEMDWGLEHTVKIIDALLRRR